MLLSVLIFSVMINKIKTLKLLNVVTDIFYEWNSAIIRYPADIQRTKTTYYIFGIPLLILHKEEHHKERP